MEEHLNSLAVTHLLQHTLRSLCIHENSQWVYAVFWRILPRNYPPPKWDGQGAYDRSRGNRRNWILVWEDGFCNFAASAGEVSSDECSGGGGSSTAYGNSDYQQYQGLQPELFFKMSHEIYNYGEGLIGKVAADHSHKWIYKEPNDQEINFLSAWHNSADSYPRTWEAQFQSGIKTIALISVREGVVQLGSVHKVVEDLSNVVMLRKKLSYIESIPGVLLPHPSSSGYPFTNASPSETWHFPGIAPSQLQPEHHQQHFYHSDHNHRFLMSNHHQPQEMKIMPSMSSLDALLSKLPSVVPPATQPGYFPFHHSAKEEMSQEDPNDAFRAQRRELVGEGSNNNNNNNYNSNDSYNNNCSNNNYDRENKIGGFLGEDF
ncbi:Serine/threonine-protein kinase WNK (With No Lysine)-related [Raphanus sativus]|uniref:Protein RICE SALT SENSITIVE 3 n=1 Tax=Raphanus sativus TaxID=3726 RepID=A0A6J0JPF9_RAPSA|nr:protein RICE SALT SENSITIVE 3 [Raphanus sativus]KAJ4887408.1 Serine/threonine-protein kinase WNK (With No Lysine)-related [Raphanus sativus]